MHQNYQILLSLRDMELSGSQIIMTFMSNSVMRQNGLEKSKFIINLFFSAIKAIIALFN